MISIENNGFNPNTVDILVDNTGGKLRLYIQQVDGNISTLVGESIDSFVEEFVKLRSLESHNFIKLNILGNPSSLEFKKIKTLLKKTNITNETVQISTEPKPKATQIDMIASPILKAPLESGRRKVTESDIQRSRAAAFLSKAPLESGRRKVTESDIQRSRARSRAAAFLKK